MTGNLRHKFNVNNTAELLTAGDGNAIYLSSKSKNCFGQHRELLPVMPVSLSTSYGCLFT